MKQSTGKQASQQQDSGKAAASSSRTLKFKDEEGVNREFRNKIANMIAYKLYLEACQRKSQRLDPSLVAMLTDPALPALSLQDKYLNEEHLVANLLGHVPLALNHPHIQIIALSNCGLSDDSFEALLQGMTQASTLGGIRLHRLDVSQNDIT